MATNWNQVLPNDKVWQGIRFKILGRANTIDDGVGHATWKENEILQNNPQWLQAQAQADANYFRDRQQLQLEEEARRKRYEASELKYKQWQQGEYLKRALETKGKDELTDTALQGDEMVAQKMRAAAVELMKTDPAAGLDMLKKAADLSREVSSSKVTELDAQSKRQERVSELGASVSDEDSYEFVKAQWAKLGFIPPQQYSEYSPATKNWLRQMSTMSTRVRAAENIDLKMQKFDLEKEKFEFDKKLKTEREARMKDKEAWNRERITRQYQTGRKISGDELSDLRKELSEIEGFKGVFTGLGAADQIEAAKEFDLIFRDILTQNPGMSGVEARQRAKEEVAARISDGKYSPYTTVTAPASTGQTATPKSKEDFDALPKGSLYINPADGKTYRKK